MSKYDYTSKGNDYKTPPVLYKKALKYFNIEEFDVDVCCSEDNIPAKHHIIEGLEDGLNEPWEKFNWCNPPFCECKKWIEKAFEEQQNGCNTAMLIPARTETEYWHKYILHNDNVVIEWLRKCYCFLDADNKPLGIFKNALAIVYFMGEK